MDPTQSDVGEGSQGFVPGGNNAAYQPPWNPFSYGYQGPSGWFSQGFQPIAPNAPMMNPSTYGPQGFQPPDIAAASKHNSEADVEEVPSPPARTGKRRLKSLGTRTKLGNFNPDEDVNLVKSWLEISCDPITNTGQKRDHMWERILARYNLRRGSDPERTVKSLQSRWDTIKGEVSLFASFYADSIRENPSGMSDACKTTHAVSNFASVHKRKFGLLHCWELMKDEPKWQDPHLRESVAAAQGEGFGVDNNNRADAMDNVVGHSSLVRSAAQVWRPTGRDSAKAAKKKANSDAGSTSTAEYAARMQDLYLQKISIMQEEAVRKNDRFQQLASFNEQMLEIERDKVRLMREKQENERLKEEKKEDERILAVNLDACTPPLRVYYQTLQQEILDKLAARRQRS